MVSQLAHSQAKTFRQAGELSCDYELKTYSAPSQHLAQWPYPYGPVLSVSVWLWWHQWNNESKHKGIIFHDFTTILPRFYQFYSSWMKNPRVKSRKNCCRPEDFYGKYYFWKTKLSWNLDVIQILVYPKVFKCYIRPSKKYRWKRQYKTPKISSNGRHTKSRFPHHIS